MRAQIIILIISAATKLCGAEVKPMVTFTPDWRIIFQYESVTISCNVEFMAQENTRYYWSKDGKLLPHHHQRMIKLEPASEENGGSYQCWVKKLKSDPVRLDVVGAPLILQAPPVIYLEEPLTLRCHSRYQRTNTTFFKNKTAIHFSVNDCELLFPSVDWSVAGSYSCSQQLFLGSKYKTFSASTIVSVRERPPTTVGGMTSMFPWILTIVLLLQLSAAAFLLFKCRHRLRIRGRHQQHTITEPEGKCNSEEDDVCYMYVDVNHLQRG
ncbi:low affinity immunoglobulin gamma Fc region receptor III-A-like [Eleutherodactylus coqui]|uniref:low affinity immunoglobulin gamma Fc region receptor III-A-like n=1 Tax=Eleutherodactylus coqui TaxID=57060 RepID=UPI003461B5DB